jgi:hypothetical protein
VFFVCVCVGGGEVSVCVRACVHVRVGVCAREGREFETRWGELFFSIYLIFPAALGRKMFLGSRARPERRADNLTAICEPIV